MEKIKVSSVKRGATLANLFGDVPDVPRTDHPAMIPCVPYTDSDGRTVDVPISVFMRALESKIAARRRAFRGANMSEYREAMIKVTTDALAMISEMVNMLPDWQGWETEQAANREGTALANVPASHPDHPDSARRS